MKLWSLCCECPCLLWFAKVIMETCVELMPPTGKVSVTGMGRTLPPTTKNLQCEKSACVLTTITVIVPKPIPH